MGAMSGMSGVSGNSGLLPRLIDVNNTITIDWSGAAVAANHKVGGVNLYHSLNPAIANTQAHKDCITYLNPEIIRIHSLEMMLDSTQRVLGWVKNPTAANYSWDAPKITSALSNLALGRTKVLTICRFPAAIADAQGKLISGKTAEFASFCVQLLQICQTANTGVTHLQLLNELDTAYTGQMATLGAIWNTVRDAIKAAFPTILVGGHAFANVYNNTNVDAYLNVCKAKMDFFAFNTYTTGSPQTSTPQQLWNSAANSIPSSLSQAKSRLANQGVGTMPIWATEVGMSYNGSSAYNGGTLRMIWEALRLAGTVKNASAGFIGAWNEADDGHGLHSSPASGYQRRPAAHLYKIWNEAIFGSVYPTTVTGDTVPVVGSTPVQGVQAIALNRTDAKRVIVLINRSELVRVVRCQHLGWIPAAGQMLMVHLITATGLQSTPLAYDSFASGFSLPIDSVAIIVSM
jgi:hypothetical protein